MALERSEDIDSIDEVLYRRFSLHQLEHGSARCLNRPDAIRRRHGRPPRPIGDEAHLTEKLSLVQLDAARRLSLKRESYIALDERKKRRFELAFLEHHFTLAEFAHSGQQGEFAQLRTRHLC